MQIFYLRSEKSFLIMLNEAYCLLKCIYKLFLIKASTLIKKFWNIPIRKRQLIAFSEMKRSVLWTKNFHLQYDSVDIGNETNSFGNEIWYFITKFITNMILKRLVSLPIWNKSHCKWKFFESKTDRSFAFSEMESFRFFFISVIFQFFSFRLIHVH